MTLADEFRQLEVDLAGEFGVAAVLTVPDAAYETAGGTTAENATTHSIAVVGPVSETKRYADSGTATVVAATFYVAAQGLSIVPTQGHRITVGSRTWVVVQVETYSVQGVDTGYRCDVGEVVDG